MPTLSSLVAAIVVISITCGATGDHKVGIMTTLGFIHWGRDKMTDIFADDIFIFMNETVRVSIKILSNNIPCGLNDNNPALVKIMD